MSTKDMLSDAIAEGSNVAVKKKASVKKKVAKKTTAKKKVASVDVIQDTVAEVEHLTKDKALAMSHTLIEQGAFDSFKLGGVLTVIHENGWWADTGFDSFRDFINEEVGIPYRKAMYLIEIYHALVESEVAWSKVKHLGWTKLKELAKVISKDNVEEWVAIAAGLTVLQLIERIKATKATSQENEEGGSQAPLEQDDNPVTTLTFKVHADQKDMISMGIEKAKKEGNTEYDAVALEYMAVGYLEGTTGLPKKPEPGEPEGGVAGMKTAMLTLGLEDTLEALDAAFPDVNFMVEQ